MMSAERGEFPAHEFENVQMCIECSICYKWIATNKRRNVSLDLKRNEKWLKTCERTNKYFNQ